MNYTDEKWREIENQRKMRTADRPTQIKNKIDRHIRSFQSIKEKLDRGENVYGDMYQLSCEVDETTRFSLPSQG